MSLSEAGALARGEMRESYENTSGNLNGWYRGAAVRVGEGQEHPLGPFCFIFLYGKVYFYPFHLRNKVHVNVFSSRE